MKHSPIKRSRTKRCWKDAEKKRGPCRVCGAKNTELAHTFSREVQDEKKIGPRDREYIWVNPDSVIPLCGPWIIEDALGRWAEAGHHQQYDARRLSILGLLTMAELRNILSAVGKHRARRRLSGRRAD